MNRIIPIRAKLIQPRHQQPISRNHDFRIARLHRKHERVIIQIARDPGELERALDHPERRITVSI